MGIWKPNVLNHRLAGDLPEWWSEIMIDEHPKIGRVSQSGAFFCYAFLFVVFYGF
jgi:hypothetical protein